MNLVSMCLISMLDLVCFTPLQSIYSYVDTCEPDTESFKAEKHVPFMVKNKSSG